MAPKEPFKVYSLTKHIEDTAKGLKDSARSKKATAKPSIKKAAASAASIFENNNSDSGSASSSSSSDDSDADGPSFMKALEKPKASKRRSKVDEIADSDAERTSAANKSKVAKQAAASAKAKAASSSDDTSSDADSESSDEEVSTKGAALKSKASTSAGSPTSSSGSDSGSGSSSSSEDSSSDDAESESESEAAPAKPAATVKKAATKPSPAKEPESDSDDSSPDESDSESEESRPVAKPSSKPAVNGTKVTAKAAKPIEIDDESDTSNDEESNNGAQSGTETSDDEEADESMQVAERAQASQVAIPQLLPPDFELRKGDQQSNGQDVARVCSEANLQGKQLWYFTLPANVPVSVVENLEFPMDASQQGGSILSHNGEDYGISFDSTPPTKSIQILIPSADGNTYQPSRHNVDEVMQIRRITQIGATTATPASVPSSAKVARPQPKGLKPRFQPIGVNSDMGTLGLDTDGEDDVEMQDAPATGTTPNASQKKAKSRKDAADPKQSASRNKKSKRKHTLSEDEDAAAAEQLMEESVSAAAKSKKQKTASRGSPDLGSEPALPALRQTFVAPPPIPGSSAADAASTPAKKTKASKSSTKPATPLLSSQLSRGGKKETPVPVPEVPSLLQPAASTGTPAEKKTKKKKTKAVAADSSV